MGVSHGCRRQWRDPTALLAVAEPCRTLGKGRFYAGGQIHTAGATIGQVRLTLEDGTELEDDAEGNIALFLADHDAAPASVTIYDTDGQLLVTHDA